MSGVKVCAWPRAYAHAAKNAIDRCFDQDSLTDAYRSCLQSTDAKVTKIVKPSVKIAVCNGKLIWTLSNASVAVHHQRKNGNFDENYEKSVRGSFEIAIDITHAIRDIYRANINYFDLLFTRATLGNTSLSFGGNNTCIINGNTITTSNGCKSFSFTNGGSHGSTIITSNGYNSFSVTNGGSHGNTIIASNGNNSFSVTNGGSCTYYSSTPNRQSTPQSSSLKRSASPLNFPDLKRHKNVAPDRYTGIGQFIKSSKTDDSIVISGISQSVDSRGDNAVIVASGVSSVIKSSGNTASITCSGTSGSVTSTGSDAWIKASGCSIMVDSRGPRALIKSSGTSTTIHSSGTNAVIKSSGTGSTVKSTGANADISFSGTDTRIMSSGSAINDDLGKTIIHRLTNAVMERLNRDLPDYSLQVDGNPHWSFANGYLCSTDQLDPQDGGDPMLVATEDVTFPEPQNSGTMLTLLVSNQVINTIGSVFHENNIHDYHLTHADLMTRATINSFGRCCCLVDCIPEFSVKYPGASMEVNLNTIEAPTAAFSDEIVKVTLLGSAVFRALLQDGSHVDFLTTDVTMETSVLLELNPGKLKGTVISILPKTITVVNSALGSLNREVLKEVFDWIVAQYLNPKMEEMAQKGIPLPLPPLSGVVEFENAVMSTAGDFLRIDTDVVFSA